MSFIIDYLLPVFYFMLLGYLLSSNRFFLSNGVSRIATLLFFSARCAAGIVADYISIHYFENGGDVALYFNDGLILYQTLLHSSPEFFVLLKQMFTIDDFGLLNPDSDFIRTVFEGIKFIHFIADLFSFGNIYTNTILFNATATLIFLRCWVFLKKYTGSWIAGCWIFLMPSALFYTANILKEGIAMVLIAALIPAAYSLYQKRNFRLIVICVLFFLLLFFFKFLIAATFVLAMLAWYLVSRFPRYRGITLTGIGVISIVLFFASAYIPGCPDLPAYLVSRQREFLAIDADSVMEVKLLQPSFLSFLTLLPSATVRALLKPLPGEGNNVLYLFHTVEIYVCWALLLYVLFKSKLQFRGGYIKGLFLGMFVFALFNLLIIGYIIPALGALVRYRSIFLPWFFIFFWYLFNGEEIIQQRLRQLSKPG